MLRNVFARLFMMAAALAVVSGVAAAQMKIAIVSMQQAVLDTAEIRKASSDMEAKYKPRQTDIERIRKELEDIQQKLQAGSDKLAPQAEADLNGQAQRKQRDLQRLSQDLQEEVDAERNEILTRTGQRMSAVVKKLAEERGFDVIVDAGSAPYFKAALDVTKDLVAAYNQAYPVK